jgi:16S rRNA (uracil1498-N3)-methyltransferase
MQNNHNDHHEFAFYYPPLILDLAQEAHATTYHLTDKTLCHRISGILRLQEGESFIVFDAQKHVQCTIIRLNKSIDVQCTTLHINIPIKQAITFLLPLLKREAFEEAIYSLTELGVNTIQPIITHKAQRNWGGSKEHERLERIIQAAAEQSKHFALPELRQPIAFAQLSELLKQNPCKTLFFDPEGTSLQETLTSINPGAELALMVGPEGDLTIEEKKLLQECNVQFCALTPTILRAQQAVVVALGSVRTFIR